MQGGKSNSIADHQSGLIILMSLCLVLGATHFISKTEKTEHHATLVPVRAIVPLHSDNKLNRAISSAVSESCNQGVVSSLPEIQMFQAETFSRRSSQMRKYVFAAETQKLKGLDLDLESKEHAIAYYWKVTPPRKSSILPQIKRGHSLELYPDVSGTWSVRLLVVKDKAICGHKDMQVDVYVPGKIPARPWRPMRSSRALVFNDFQRSSSGQVM